MNDWMMGWTVGLVRVWTRFYTLGLPAEQRQDRQAEIESDLWEHVRDMRERGSRTTTLSIIGRMLAGTLDDLTWRVEQAGDNAAPVPAGRRTVVQRNETSTIPKKVVLASAVIASVAALSFMIHNALRHSGGIEIFVTVQGAVILLALVWMVYAHYPSLFTVSLRTPGVLQVGLEVVALSGLALGIPWAVSHAAAGFFVPAPWGVLLLMLSVPAAAAWVGVRVSRRSRMYVAAQGMVAALCFYPVWVLGYGFLGFALDPGFVGLREPWLSMIRDVQTVLILTGGPFFAAVAFAIAELARQVPARRATS